jgi:hypothetical protein
VNVSSSKTIDQFKSPIRVSAKNLLRSRETQKHRAAVNRLNINKQRADNVQLRREILHLKLVAQQTQAQLHSLEALFKRTENAPIELPADPSLPHHSFGPKMISLAINIACTVGLRAAEKVIKTFFDWLQIKTPVPDWTSIRMWLCRYGVGLLEEPIEQADDWILMADHSNQIGTDKVLVILGIRACQMPPNGHTLRYEDMRVIAVVPGTNWQREDVAKQYKLVAERIGTPLAIVTDGAVELRESAVGLKNEGKIVMMFRDFKHVAANEFKRLLEQDNRFAQFQAKLGQTRSAIQQTELAHFTPPSPKQKARFMNLESHLNWAEMVLWQLSHPNSAGRTQITAKRMNAKLGWLRGFRDDIARWNRCQDIINRSLTVINEEGLYRGAAKNLRSALSFLGGCAASDALMNKLTSFVEESEQQLPEGIRVPLSTEILESSFGQYKLLERQHSKGGFTTLIAAYPGLLKHCTADLVKQTFSRMPVSKLKEWTSKQLGRTLACRRKQAYGEVTQPI